MGAKSAPEKKKRTSLVAENHTQSDMSGSYKTEIGRFAKKNTSKKPPKMDVRAV
jgi:hypothetical protein